MDALSTKPLDPRVLDAMLPYYISIFGNPHSRTHQYGWNAEKGVEKARQSVAELIKADSKDIIFTSGATESNNLAIKGVVSFAQKDKKRVHVITTQIEHKCVMNTFRKLEEDGVEVTYLPVKEDGQIDVRLLEKSITPDTILVSVMAVNNEIGVIQPLSEIGDVCRKKGVIFHTDAAQAYGSIPIDVDTMKIDLLSLSGHKIYGPKGVGALYARRKPRVHLDPLIHGGGQERGLRSGTTPPPLCVGLGKAAEICSSEMQRDSKYIDMLSRRLSSKILNSVDHTIVNSGKKDEIEKCGTVEDKHVKKSCLNILDDDTPVSIPGCVNISFQYVEGEGLMMKLSDVAVSSGSACTSASLEPSYVLRALGKKDDVAHSSIRFGISKFTTKKEIDEVARKVVEGVNDLRKMSPLYEMVKDGIDLDQIKWSE